MNTHRLHSVAIASPQYAIVGQCTSAHAVEHVGILENACSLIDGQTVAVFEMAGVLEGIQLPGEMQANAVGWVPDLTAEDGTRIAAWFYELRSESIQITYIAYPAWGIDRDKVTGRVIGRKFSCAGFVHCCFEEALQIRLVVPESQLPEANVELLQKVWGRVVTTRHGQQYLAGPPPWRVLLPSYLFHALAVGRSEMPHCPTRADPCFPP